MIPAAAKEMVLRRLEEMPPRKEVIIQARPYRREELIEHVKLEDRVGKQMIMKQVKIVKALRFNGVWH